MGGGWVGGSWEGGGDGRLFGGGWVGGWLVGGFSSSHLGLLE